MYQVVDAQDRPLYLGPSRAKVRWHLANTQGARVSFDPDEYFKPSWLRRLISFLNRS